MLEIIETILIGFANWIPSTICIILVLNLASDLLWGNK